MVTWFSPVTYNLYFLFIKFWHIVPHCLRNDAVLEIQKCQVLEINYEKSEREENIEFWIIFTFDLYFMGTVKLTVHF